MNPAESGGSCRIIGSITIRFFHLGTVGVINLGVWLFPFASHPSEDLRVAVPQKYSRNRTVTVDFSFAIQRHRTLLPSLIETYIEGNILLDSIYIVLSSMQM